MHMGYRGGMPQLGVLVCGAAGFLLVGCGASSRNVAAPMAPTAPAVTSTAAAAAVVAPPTAPPSANTQAVTQQLQSIDSTLKSIDGETNSANAGLSTGEGDPTQ